MGSVLCLKNFAYALHALCDDVFEYACWCSRQDVLQMLPQSVALANIPYTPSRSMAHDLYVSSPVCSHPK